MVRRFEMLKVSILERVLEQNTGFVSELHASPEGQAVSVTTLTHPLQIKRGAIRAQCERATVGRAERLLSLICDYEREESLVQDDTGVTSAPHPETLVGRPGRPMAECASSISRGVRLRSALAECTTSDFAKTPQELWKNVT